MKLFNRKENKIDFKLPLFEKKGGHQVFYAPLGSVINSLSVCECENKNLHTLNVNYCELCNSSQVKTF